MDDPLPSLPKSASLFVASIRAPANNDLMALDKNTGMSILMRGRMNITEMEEAQMSIRITLVAFSLGFVAMTQPVLADQAPIKQTPTATKPAQAPAPAGPTTAKQVPTLLPKAKGGCPPGSTPYDLDYQGPGTMRCRVNDK